VPEDHLEYFVSDLVDQLALSAITTVYEEEDRGYPPYHPVMLTKVLVYACCVGVFFVAEDPAPADRGRCPSSSWPPANEPDFRTHAVLLKVYL